MSNSCQSILSHLPTMLVTFRISAQRSNESDNMSRGMTKKYTRCMLYVKKHLNKDKSHLGPLT